jgi:hypothetical protein
VVMKTLTSNRRGVGQHARETGNAGNMGAVRVKGLREFFNSTAGKAVAILLILVALGAAYYSIRSNLGRSEAADLSRDRMFICSETLKPFQHDIVEGEPYPVVSPFSGKNTGYPAEACYWTKDGQTKEQPTYVLLNLAIHKREPTFCPDCGRLVVGHNPRPQPGDKPPPTKSEYTATHAGQ